MSTHGTITVNHQLSNGAAFGDTIYPGGFLDPNFGANDRVWLASGVIERLDFMRDSALQNVTIEIFDAMGAEGRPVKAAAGGPYYCVVDANAVALHRSLSSATAVFEVVARGAVPAELIQPRSRRWRMLYDPMADTFEDKVCEVPMVSCPFGMAIRVVSGGAMNKPMELNITYRPDVLGAARYKQSIMVHATPAFGGR